MPTTHSDADVDAVGVDGWTGGWICAALDGPSLKWVSYPSFAQIVTAYPNARIGVDIPIGLPYAGSRACDVQARAFLVAARSSIFAAPTRPLLHRWRADRSYPRDLPKGMGVSRQTWGLLSKIDDVDRSMSAGLQDRVAEVHPECSFRTLRPAAWDSKKTARGVQQRLDALSQWRPLPSLLDAPARVPIDDVLDATAAAWTARRWAHGEAVTLGDGRCDERGLLMRIIR